MGIDLRCSIGTTGYGIGILLKREVGVLITSVTRDDPAESGLLDAIHSEEMVWIDVDRQKLISVSIRKSK